MLSVGTRKAGTQARCPKCGTALTVPTPEEAAAALAMLKSDKPPEAAPFQLSDLVVYDEPSPPPLATRSAAAPVEYDSRWVTFPRRMLFVQGALVGLVVLAAFLAGFFSGRGARVEPPGDGVEQEPAAVSGQVSFQGRDQSKPDSGAVLVFLPAGAVAAQRIAAEGLSPRQPPPPADDRAVAAIRAVGGEYVRADQKGQFTVRLRPGRYRVLAISAHAVRSLGAEPEPADLEWLGKWFDPAPELIGPAKYRLATEQLPPADPLAIDLGASGRP